MRKADPACSIVTRVGPLRGELQIKIEHWQDIRVTAMTDTFSQRCRIVRITSGQCFRRAKLRNHLIAT